MRARTTLVLLLAVAAAAAQPPAARAFCGFYVAGADSQLYNNATMVVMMRDGTRTVLAMQNNYEGPVSDFALVIPVPVVLQEENVKTLGKDVFQRVDRLASPRLVEYWEQDPCFQPPEYEGEAVPSPMAMAAEDRVGAGGGDHGVTIEAQFEVGEYQILILSAQDSGGLETWLRENNYRIPEGAEPVLRPYVQAGMKFFVAKVDITKVTFENGQAMLSPLRFHYDTDEFSLPVRLGLLNSRGTQDLIVHILAPNQRYEMANYPNVTIPTNIDVANNVRERFGEFYAALYDETLERNPRAIVTEYAWQATNCDPCPGPVLSESDLMTLGADVLPSLGGGGRRPVVTLGSPTVVRGGEHPGNLPADVVQFMAQRQQAALQACYQAAMGRGVSWTGSVTAELRVLADGRAETSAEGWGGVEADLHACASGVLNQMRFPSPEGGVAIVTLPITFTAEPTNPWEVQQQMQSFVLTRLHARYSREALSDDLVFRAANAIVGGREHVVAEGRLENGSRPDSANNFQARYAIRHLWEGEIDCATPRRGVWGGPPDGRQPEPRAAQDLAFAPRGRVQLPQLVRQNIPEIGITAAAQPTLPTGGGGGGGGTATGGGGGDAGGCGCRVSHDGAGMALPLALLALAFLRRRRSR